MINRKIYFISRIVLIYILFFISMARAKTSVDCSNLNIKTASSWKSFVLGCPVDAVKSAISKHSDLINLKDDMGRTALFYAAQKGESGLIQFLISHGASIDVRDVYGWIPLFVANSKETATVLIKAGEDWKMGAVNNHGVNGMTPLHIAAVKGRAWAVKALLDAGAFVNIRDDSGNTPLLLAAKNRHWDVVKTLLDAGSDPNICNQQDDSALKYAVLAKNTRILKLLLEHHADPQGCGNHALTLMAAKNGYWDGLKLLVKFGAPVNVADDSDRGLLYLAAQSGHADVVNVLLDAGADVDAVAEDGSTPIIIAAENNHWDVVKLLISAGANLNVKGDWGKRLIHFATLANRQDVVRLLIEFGAPVNIQDDSGETPLLIAVKAHHPEIARFLIEHGAFVDLCDNQGRTPLLIAVNKGYSDLVTMLLEHGADPLNQDRFNTTPVHVAVKSGRLNIFKILVKHNSKALNVVDGAGYNPLIYSIIYHRDGVLNYLLKAGIDHCQQINGTTAVHMAVLYKNTYALKAIGQRCLDVVDQHGQTPLFYAIHNGFNDMALTLIDLGADVNKKGPHGFTPLHMAAYKGDIQLVNALIKHGANVNAANDFNWTPIMMATNEPVLKALSAAGASWESGDINGADESKKTLVHWAALTNNVWWLSTLIKGHADLNRMDEAGNTPLHLAVMHNAKGAVSLLLKAGAKVDIARPFDGWTPAFEASFRGYTDILEQLISAGADIHHRTSYGWTPLCVAHDMGVVLLLSGDGASFTEADLNGQDPYGWTPLHWVAAYGRTQVMKALLNAGATVEVQDKKGRTPLHLAAFFGHSGAVSYLYSKLVDYDAQDNFGVTPMMYAAFAGRIKVLDQLYGYGANIDKKDKYAFTALHWAALGGHPDVVNYLVKRGASLKASDNQGRTPLHIAVMMGFRKAVMKLLENGAPLQLEDNHHWTPLNYACANDLPQLVHLLLIYGADKDGGAVNPFETAVKFHSWHSAMQLIKEGARVNFVTSDGITPLLIALKNGRQDLAEFILSKGAHPVVLAPDLKTPVHFAALHGMTSLIRFFVKHGVMINWQDKYGWPALFLAKDKDTLNTLIKLGAKWPVNKINNRDHNGYTPLMFAVRNDFYDLAKALLNYDAGIGGIDKKGRGVLHLAVLSKDPDMVKLILNAGAMVDSLDFSGNTPLHLAVKQGNLQMVKLLVGHSNFIINVRNNKHQSPLIISIHKGLWDIAELLINHGADINVDEPLTGMTFLSWSIQHAPVNFVRFILKRDIEVQGRIPPIITAIKQHKVDIIQELLTHYAGPNDTDSDGNNPVAVLGFASDIDFNTRATIFNTLVQAGTDIDQINKKGASAVDSAKIPAYIKLLKKAGALSSSLR